MRIVVKLTLLMIVAVATQLCILPQAAFAQFAFGGDGPIQVNGDKIEYQGPKTILTGQVEVIQADSRILADQMILHRATLANGQLGDVTTIDAIGNFYYIAPEQKVRGEKGVYDQAKNVITVTGNVVLGDDTGNIGTTDVFVYDLTSKNAVLEGTCKGRQCKSGRPSLIIDNSGTRP